MGPDNGQPDSRIQPPLSKSEVGCAHRSRPRSRRLWDSLLFETESRFETARVVSQGPVGFRAWAESNLKGLKDSRTQELKNSRTQELKNPGIRKKALACIGHKSLEICDRCRLWQRNSPATPENSAAFWRREFRNSLFSIPLF